MRCSELSQSMATYASTIFVIYVKLDEKRNTRVCKEMSDKAFNSCRHLPSLQGLRDKPTPGGW